MLGESHCILYFDQTGIARDLWSSLLLLLYIMFICVYNTYMYMYALYYYKYRACSGA